jgi:exodeoxyribonuclease III
VKGVRLLSWNILAGGGTRCAPILEVLRRYDPDIITLQETMPGRAKALCHVLGAAGYAYGLSAPLGRHDRGQCVLSRIPLARVVGRRPPHARIHPRGWLEVELIGFGVRLAAVYGPPEGAAIPAYWGAAAIWLAGRASSPFVMLGDFNAGESLVDADGYRFRSGKAFASLADIGLVDLWRREHGDRREHTWFSRPGLSRRGRGFRIDHAFASRDVADSVTSCRYDHHVRKSGLSDHSLLVIDVGLS